MRSVQAAGVAVKQPLWKRRGEERRGEERRGEERRGGGEEGKVGAQ